MTAAALTEAARRITEIWPAVSDNSGNPHPAQSEDLPVFALTFEAESATPVALGSPDYETSGTMTLSVWLPIVDTPAARDGLADAADQATATLTADSSLGGAAWQIGPAGWDYEFAAGERRTARLDVRFSLVVIGPVPGVTAPAPLT